MSVGKRLYFKRNMPSPEILKGFQSIPASNVADCMERICAINPRIKLIFEYNLCRRLKKVYAAVFSQFLIRYSLGGKHPGFPVYSLILL